MRNRFVIGIAVLIMLGFGTVLYAQQNGGDRGGDRGGRPGGGQWRAAFEQFRNTMQLMGTVRGISELNKDKAHGLSKGQAKQILGILQPLRTQAKLTPDQAKAASEKLTKVFTRAQIEIMDQMRTSRRGGRGGRDGGGPGRGQGFGGPGRGQGDRGPGRGPGLDGPGRGQGDGGPGRGPGFGGEGRGQGQGGPGRGPGNGGPGRGQGGRGFDPNAMKNFNPFYAKAAANDDRSKENAKRMDAVFTELKAKANGK